MIARSRAIIGKGTQVATLSWHRSELIKSFWDRSGVTAWVPFPSRRYRAARPGMTIMEN
jgi:hypothetical protein